MLSILFIVVFLGYMNAGYGFPVPLDAGLDSDAIVSFI